MSKVFYEEFWETHMDGSLLGKFLSWLREEYWDQHFVQVALRHTQRGQVLEAGCGTALSSILVAERRGDQITGLDLSPIALILARQFAEKHRTPLPLVLGDMRRMPFPEKSFDVVWNSGTLEHYDEPIPILQEMWRVGKKVIAIFPERSLPFTILDWAIRPFSSKIRRSFLNGDEHFRTLREIRQIFERAGFRRVVVERIRCLGIFPYVAAIGE